MAYSSQLDIIGDDSFLRRTRIAMLVSAMSNSNSSVAVVKELSVSVLNDSDAYLRRFAQALCARIPTLDESTSDNDVQTAIDSIFPMIAGA